MDELMNYEGVCRTALATPGLLKIGCLKVLPFIFCPAAHVLAIGSVSIDMLVGLLVDNVAAAPISSAVGVWGLGGWPLNLQLPPRVQHLEKTRRV